MDTGLTKSARMVLYGMRGNVDGNGMFTATFRDGIGYELVGVGGKGVGITPQRTLAELEAKGIIRQFHVIEHGMKAEDGLVYIELTHWGWEYPLISWGSGSPKYM